MIGLHAAQEAVRATISRHRQEQAQLEHDFDQALAQAFDLMHGRRARRKPKAKLLALDEKLFQDVRERYQAMVDVMLARQRRERREAEDERYSAAAAYVPPRREAEVLLHRASGYTYSTQTDATGYARNEAMRWIDRAEGRGIRAEMRRATGRPFVEFEVWAWTSELGADAIRYGPDLPMREVVRRCWARATNPRVMWPFLPHGYEQEQGIGPGGQDLRPLEQRSALIVAPRRRRPRKVYR